MRRIRKKGRGRVGGRGRYLDIGRGRCLAVDGGGDYYISTKPQRIEGGRPIEKIMWTTPKEGYRCFRIDTAHYYDIVAVGIIMDLDGLLWVAGDVIGEEEEKLVAILPPFVVRYPKKRPANVSPKHYLAQVGEEAVAKATGDLRKAGYLRSDEDLGTPCEQALAKGLADLRKVQDKYKAQDKMMGVNQSSQQVTNNNNIWTMEILKSSFHNCASGNCPHCRGAHANIWTMEQLKSSLDNCATGNCPHCCV